jgi:hypothetical protein
MKKRNVYRILVGKVATYKAGSRMREKHLNGSLGDAVLCWKVAKNSVK